MPLGGTAGKGASRRDTQNLPLSQIDHKFHRDHEEENGEFDSLLLGARITKMRMNGLSLCPDGKRDDPSIDFCIASRNADYPIAICLPTD
jgi:hypothetical protein